METQAKSRKPKFWHGILIGVLAGLAVAGIVYLIVQPEKGTKFLKEIRILHPKAEQSDSTDVAQKAVVQKTIVYDTVCMGFHDSLMVDDIFFQNVEDTLENVDFALEEDVESQHVVHNACLATRSVSVEPISNLLGDFPDFSSFEVEQWSDYAKNRMSYQRTGNVLKIKGVDIQNIRIVYVNGQYKLIYNDHGYYIPETSSFVKLVAKP